MVNSKFQEFIGRPDFSFLDHECHAYQIYFSIIRILSRYEQAYLGLLLVDPDNKQFWYPDPSTWDSNTATGTLGLYNRKYTRRWTFNIPSDGKIGEYKALVLLCENGPENGPILFDFQEKMFYVKM